jgi:hypothetical protein
MLQTRNPFFYQFREHRRALKTMKPNLKWALHGNYPPYRLESAAFLRDPYWGPLIRTLVPRDMIARYMPYKDVTFGK